MPGDTAAPRSRRRSRVRTATELIQAIGRERVRLPQPPEPTPTPPTGDAPVSDTPPAESGAVSALHPRRKRSCSRAEYLIRQVWDRAHAGDLRATRFLFEYAEGKPVERVVEATAEAGAVFTDAEKQELIDAAQARLERWRQEMDAQRTAAEAAG